ncbi:MAG: 30S ribosomal protein S2 [Dysgonamonadaceae bacterium]|nr:30S ribosomal protein S2 [Dysgonamonadaceae bacterium]MDD4727396.1 30S ribosomal protein S2 [Dysgonamonadaceae bacterium]
MAILEFDQLLEAGAHFGHLKRKWNPAMAPYIFMERNGIHIIDLYKTIAKTEEAANALRQMAKSGKRILFVATKKQGQAIIEDTSLKLNMPYVIERWPGGMLTNFPTIRKAVKKMSSIDRMIKDGTFDTLSKREKLQVTRQRAKLEKNLGSIQDLTRLPAAIFVVDIMKEQIAVREANKLGIPVFAIVDTNSDPRDIDFVIPANDDSSKSIEIIMNYISTSIREGLEERKVERADANAKEEQEQHETGERRERKSKAGRRERVVKREVKEETPTASGEESKPTKENKPAEEAKPIEKSKPAEESKPVDISKDAVDKKAEE